MDSLRGQLLIAGPTLVDPNFWRTVVLVGEHNDEGALGVVLNRPAPVTVREAVPPLETLVDPGDRLFFGGPVEPQGAVVVSKFAHPDDADLLVFDSIGFLVGEVQSIALEGVRRARVFAGHAGWGPGQLEVEIRENSWIVERATPEDVFTDEPDQLWRRVLRRKGGKFALLSTMPPDPSTN